LEGLVRRNGGIEVGSTAIMEAQELWIAGLLEVLGCRNYGTHGTVGLHSGTSIQYNITTSSKQ
jgi:hypothetical protein